MKRYFLPLLATIIFTAGLSPLAAYGLPMPANIPSDASVVLSEVNPFTITSATPSDDMAEYIEVYN